MPLWKSAVARCGPHIWGVPSCPLDDRSMLELKTEHAELIGTASHSAMSVAAIAQALPWSLLHVPGGR